MEALLHYATDVDLNAFKSLGKYYDAMFLTEKCHHESDFIPQHISEEFKKACESTDTTIYKLVIAVVAKHGQPTYDSSWRYEPKCKTFWIGFLGTSYDEVMQAAMQYCQDNTDHSIKPFAFKLGSFNPVIQPLVIRTKTYPHYLDKNDD